MTWVLNNYTLILAIIAHWVLCHIGYYGIGYYDFGYDDM